MYCALTRSRSGRNPAGGGGATLIFCQGRGGGLCRRAHGRWLGSVEGCNLPRSWEPWRHFSLRLRSENTRHRAYQFSPVFPVRRGRPAPGGGSSPIPAVVFVEGPPTGNVLDSPYWVHIGRHIWLRHAIRRDAEMSMMLVATANATLNRRCVLPCGQGTSRVGSACVKCQLPAVLTRVGHQTQFDSPQ